VRRRLHGHGVLALRHLDGVVLEGVAARAGEEGEGGGHPHAEAAVAAVDDVIRVDDAVPGARDVAGLGDGADVAAALEEQRVLVLAAALPVDEGDP